MPLQEHHAASTDHDESATRDDQPARESAVPPDLRALFERPATEQSIPQPLDVFQPADWPSCPDCADRLIASSVVTDAQDTLVAAAMRCYNSEHETRRYVYDVVTETVYFDQVCAGPATGSPDG